ncbi:hypothetical protein ACJ41O_001704 [Fusarium nematophilum]
MDDAELRNQLADLRTKFISEVIHDAWVAWQGGVLFVAETRLILLRLLFDYVGGNAYIHVLVVLILWPFGTHIDGAGLMKATYPFYLWLCGFGASAKGVFYLVRFGLPALVYMGTVVLVCQLYHRLVLHGFHGGFGAVVRVVILAALEEFAIHNHLRLQEVTFAVIKFWSDWPWLQVTRVSPLLAAILDLTEPLIFSNLSILFEHSIYQRREKRAKALAEPMSRLDGIPDYAYENLAEGEIRLVQIYLDPITRKPKYRLVKAALEKAPRYHAISYVWGSAERTHALVIDDAWLQTTATTFEILHDHALFWCTCPEDFFWIDFLCINQNDLAERSEQVKLMGSIYSQAADVITFLRPEDYDDVDTAGAFFTNLREDVVRKHRRTYGPPVFRLGGFKHPLITYGVNFIAASTDTAPSPGWSALSKLFAHSYWTRMWVIQEVILSRQIRIFYGERSFEWEGLLRLASSGLEDLLHIDFELSGFVKGENFEESRSRVSRTLGRRMSYGDGKPVLFVDILTACRLMQATDPRDQIFALYGLLTGNQVPESLMPDYMISTRTLYTRVATHFVTNGNSEWILCMASPGYSQRGHHDRIPCPSCRSESFVCGYYQDLPSWVPDWRSPYPRVFPQALPRTGDSEGESMQAVMVEKSLFVSSWTVGRIDRLVELHLIRSVKDETSEVFERFWNTLSSISDMLSALDPEYPTGGPTVDALAKTMLPMSGDDILEPFRRTWAACHTMRKSLEILKGALELDGFGDSFFANAAMSEVSVALSTAGVDDWAREAGHIEMRSVALTDSGLFALVPRYSKVGDVVCVLKGAKSSFVMRPVDQGVVQLVGDCHVHEASRSKKGDPERIEIR